MDVAANAPDNFPELGLNCLGCGFLMSPSDGGCELCALEVEDAKLLVAAASVEALRIIEGGPAEFWRAGQLLARAVDELEKSRRALDSC